MKFTDHPDDQAARHALTEELYKQRLRRSMTQLAVAEASGLTVARVSLLERRPEHIGRFRLYSRYANAVGLSFSIVPAGDAYAATPLPPVLVDRDDYHQFSAMQQIVETRHRTIKVGLVAARMNVGITAVQKLEALDRDDPSVATWQAYTRSVGGHLDLILSPFDDESVTT